MTEEERFLQELKKYTGQADAVISRFLPSGIGTADTPPEMDDIRMPLTVAEAMNYSVQAGGKRVRPLIMSLTFDLFGGRNRKLLEPFMAAIEMIHTYSLVHDDLPAMDNDEYRRGKKTTHAVFGEAMAILAGDGLLNYAYETALCATEYCSDPTELMQVVLALRILCKKAGISGMIGGQCVDIESEKHAPEEPDMALYFIEENKTAALIEAAFMCGAILAGARVEAVDMTERIGSLTGRCFQICDDILDVKGDSETLGKTAGKDAQSGKLTYVSLYGMERAEADAFAMTNEALHLLSAIGAREDDFLVRLVRALLKRER